MFTWKHAQECPQQLHSQQAQAGGRPFRERGCCSDATTQGTAQQQGLGRASRGSRGMSTRLPRASLLRKDPTTQRGLPGARTAHTGTSEVLHEPRLLRTTRGHTTFGHTHARPHQRQGCSEASVLQGLPGQAPRTDADIGRQGGRDAPPGYFSTTSCGPATTPKHRKGRES